MRKRLPARTISFPRGDRQARAGKRRQPRPWRRERQASRLRIADPISRSACETRMRCGMLRTAIPRGLEGDCMPDLLSTDLLMFIAIGFFAQIIDGALGLAFGVLTTTILLSIGVPPAAASAMVHVTECFT